MSTAQVIAAPIGGFFETHAPEGGGPDLLRTWTEGRPFAAFVNARSAFAALVAMRPGATVWLPAFLCADMAPPALAARTRFYPVAPDFTPRLEIVEAQAKGGDIVLLAATFGLPVRHRPVRKDLLLVEDRAQALNAGPALSGAWALFSPRKLLGVADGGILVAPDGVSELPRPRGRPDAGRLWAAPDLRASDPEGRKNVVWHAANQAKETAMAVGDEAMTDRSLTVLSHTSSESLVEARLRNWRRLDRALRPWSALAPEPGVAPLGYVLRLPAPQREALRTHLLADRIFAAVHWPRLASPDAREETAWTRELLTLPCDHRYGAREMDRIAARAREVLV